MLHDVLTVIGIFMNGVLIYMLYKQGKSNLNPGVEDSLLGVHERDYSAFDDRITAIKQEIDLINSLPSDADVLDRNVYNLPHKVITMDTDPYPAVEEESEEGYVETAR